MCIYVFAEAGSDAARVASTLDCAFPKLRSNQNGHARLLLREFDASTWVPDVRSRGQGPHARADLASPYNWFRFYLSEDMLDGATKAIYMDCDMLALVDVTKLHDIDLHGSAIGAVSYPQDASSFLCLGNPLVAQWRLSGDGTPLLKDVDHVNAGLLLIDLTQWREQRVLQRWKELLERHDAHSPTRCLWDQGGQIALMMLLGDKIRPLDRRWNLGWLGAYGWLRRTFGDANATKHVDSARDAFALHWSGKEKPWANASHARAKELWEQYTKPSDVTCCAQWAATPQRLSRLASPPSEQAPPFRSVLPLLHRLGDVLHPSARTSLHDFYSAGGDGASLSVALDDTCIRPADWTAIWAEPPLRSATDEARIKYDRVSWAEKYGAASFLPHMFAQSGFYTRDWRKADAILVLLFAHQAAGQPAISQQQCLQRLRRESEAFKATSGDRHFFLFTGDNGPCCVDGRYKDVDFLRYRVIGNHGMVGVEHQQPRWGAAPPIPCFDARKDISIPTPSVHAPLVPHASEIALAPELEAFEAQHEAQHESAEAAAATMQQQQHGRSNQTKAKPKAYPRRDLLLFAVGSNPYSACRTQMLALFERHASSLIVVRKSLPRNATNALMLRSRFCPICSGFSPWTQRLPEVIAAGCVPIVITERWVLPFEQILDYSTFSGSLPLSRLPELLAYAQSLDHPKLLRNVLRAHAAFRFDLRPSRSATDLLPLLLFEMHRRLASAVPAAAYDFIVPEETHSGVDTDQDYARPSLTVPLTTVTGTISLRPSHAYLNATRFNCWTTGKVCACARATHPSQQRGARADAGFDDGGGHNLTREADEWIRAHYPRQSAAESINADTPAEIPAVEPDATGGLIAGGGASSARSFVLLQAWSFDLSQSRFANGSSPTLERRRVLLQTNVRWCQRSHCCAAYSFYTESPAESASALPMHWPKVMRARQLLDNRPSRPVVYLDTDAVLLAEGWCPSFRRASAHQAEEAMLVAPDPAPWVEPLNAGFFAVAASRAGRAVLDAWWGAYLQNASSCWEPGGACEACRTNYTACRSRPCIWGGACSDQYSLIHSVLPLYGRQLHVLPRSFQSTSKECDGVVKHFTGGWRIMQHAASVIARCATKA